MGVAVEPPLLSETQRKVLSGMPVGGDSADHHAHAAGGGFDELHIASRERSQLTGLRIELLVAVHDLGDDRAVILDMWREPRNHP